jgi:hypothetical protein
VGDPLLAPRRVVTGHTADEPLQIRRDWGPSRGGFPSPEQPEPLAMPAGQRRRLYHGQCMPPVEPAGEPEQGDSDGIGGKKRLAAIRCKKMPLHRAGKDRMAVHERPWSLTIGVPTVFPQTGKTGRYQPENPSSRGSEGQFYQKIAKVRTKSGNLWCFSCIVSQLALSYPYQGPRCIKRGGFGQTMGLFHNPS